MITVITEMEKKETMKNRPMFNNYSDYRDREEMMSDKPKFHENSVKLRTPTTVSRNRR